MKCVTGIFSMRERKQIHEVEALSPEYVLEVSV